VIIANLIKLVHLNLSDMSPVDGSPSGNMGGFELICSLNANSKANAIPFHMYKSTNTGITICIAEVDGPVVSGYFNLGN